MLLMHWADNKNFLQLRLSAVVYQCTPVWQEAYYFTAALVLNVNTLTTVD